MERVKTSVALVGAVWAFGITMFIGELYNSVATHEVSAGPDIPVCIEEDGSDVDGLCVWTDPDTGDMYLNPTWEEMFR